MRREITSQPFTRDEIPRIRDLISSVWGQRQARAYLHIGDLYWALRQGGAFSPERDIRLWEAGEDLVAFAWFDGPASGEVVMRAGAPAQLELDAISWLETQHRRSAADAPFAIVAIDDDLHRTTMLARLEYARGDGGGHRFHQPIGARLESAQPPDGFTVRSVSSEDDVGRRVYAQKTSFEGSSATVDVWHRLMALPGYRSELDLIAVAPDGTGAGGCTCWYDEANRAGEFEPVGTSRAYQRTGIGKALIAEGLRRLQAAGATQAIVQTNITNEAAIALYRSCGFELAAIQHEWTKAL